MRRLMLPLILGLAVACMAVPASARSVAACDIDVVPAATLLLPYFEANLAGPEDTILSIRNAFSRPIRANVVVWTDRGVPVLAFPVVLKGFGSYDFSFRDILVNGIIPANDPGTFADCRNLLPVPPLTPTLLQHFRNVLTGNPSVLFDNLCAGRKLATRPNVAHGYATVDVVSKCTLQFPGSGGYFKDGGAGIATDDNYLWGQSILYDPVASIVHAEPVVHLEAFKNKKDFPKDTYTFYGRLIGWNGSDDREPLSTNFMAGFALGGFYGGTELLVWRDPRSLRKPFPCAVPPEDLDQFSIKAFSDDAVVRSVSGNPFPAATQRVRLGTDVPMPPDVGDFGWLFLNLSHKQGAGPPGAGDTAQAWVIGLTNSSAPPILTGSYEATRLDSACNGKSKAKYRFPKVP